MTESLGVSSKILIAEDDPLVRLLMERALVQGGYLVTAAENGAEALEKLPKDTFDLIVTDIEMPILEGDELISRVRSGDARYAHLPILVHSRTTKPKVLKTLKQFGVPVLSKPFKASELLSAVETLVAAS